MDSPEEYAELKICQLYDVINGEEVFAMLNIIDRDVLEMLKPFAIIMEEYKTVISQGIWNFHVQKHSALLTLPEIATEIWAPVFTEIQELIEKFSDSSVTVMKIGYYLKDVLSQNLEEEIQKLVEGCNLSLEKTMGTSWIRQFVNSVNDYRDACKAQSVAQLVLAAKDALMLTGNFDELKKLKSKVFVFQQYSIFN